MHTSRSRCECKVAPLGILLQLICVTPHNKPVSNSCTWQSHTAATRPPQPPHSPGQQTGSCPGVGVVGLRVPPSPPSTLTYSGHTTPPAPSLTRAANSVLIISRARSTFALARSYWHCRPRAQGGGGSRVSCRGAGTAGTGIEVGMRGTLVVQYMCLCTHMW